MTGFEHLDPTVPENNHSKWQQKESWFKKPLSSLHLQYFEILMGKDFPATTVPTTINYAKELSVSVELTCV